MHSISVTPRATYRHWRGQGLNRLCLRWPSLRTMWRVAWLPYETRKGLDFRWSGSGVPLNFWY